MLAIVLCLQNSCYIDSRQYALPYQSEGRCVVKVGVTFDAETRTPQEWRIEDGAPC